MDKIQVEVSVPKFAQMQSKLLSGGGGGGGVKSLFTYLVSHVIISKQKEVSTSRSLLYRKGQAVPKAQQGK